MYSHLTHISSVYFNKETGNNILFNEHIDKIVILQNDLNLSVLDTIQEDLIKFFENYDTKFTTQYIIKEFDNITKNKNIEDILELYFNNNASKSFKGEMLQILLFKLHQLNYILLPFSLVKTNLLYLNLSTKNIQDLIFDKNTDIGKFVQYLKNHISKKKNKKHGNLIFKFFQLITLSTNIQNLSDFHPDIFKYFLKIEDEYRKTKSSNSSLNTFKQLANIFAEYYLNTVNEYNWKEIYLDDNKYSKYVFFNDFYTNGSIPEIWITLSNQYMHIKTE